MILLFALPGGSTLWWVVGIAIAALLLLMFGRLGARAGVAGQLPPETGPDLKASEQGQEPDIRPEDQDKPRVD